VPALLFLILLFVFTGEALSDMARVERSVLPNGLVLLLYEEHSLPFVTFKALVDAGSWRESDKAAGLANLTASGLTLGTSEYTAGRINEEIDFLGAFLDTSCGRDFSTLSLKVLKKNLTRGLSIFLEALQQPVFPEDEVERMKRLILGKIRAARDNPREVAEKVFLENLLPGSPYGKPVEGTEDTLPHLKREDLRRFYRSYYGPEKTILAIVGDITREEVRDLLVSPLEKWTSREAPHSFFEADFEEKAETIVTDRPISQANIVIGHKGIPRTHGDYYAVSVMNHILGGGGLGSRLLKAIRIERGLAYSVSSSFVATKRAGFFRIALQTKNESAGDAVRLALEEMEKMRQEPVTEEDLETSKSFLVGNFPLRLTTQDSLAAFFSQAEYYGLGLDYRERYPDLIGKIDREDVLRAAKDHLHPERAIVSIVGDKSLLTPDH